MRLIDADAIKYHEYLEPMGNGMYVHAGIVDDKEIDAQPTIEAVPVRHGKWKKSGNWGRVYKCDQCGNYLDFDGVNAGRGDANYCPNCGAKMDEVEE